MASYKSPMERFIEATQKTADATLRWYYQKEMMMRDILDRQERAALVEEVANLVLSRISATVDATEIFEQIDGLKKSLDELYNYFE